MTIYVDTNILPRWGTLAAPHVAALLAVARATSNRIVLPSLVLEESVSARRRNAESAFEALSAAHKRASRYSNTVTTYIPSAEDVAAEWRQDLTESFDIVNTPPEVALEALRREAHRHPPAGRGVGGRDAAIWLTVLDDCSRVSDPAYFVSENTSDFANPTAKDELHPTLLADCPEDSVLIFKPSVDALLHDLATQVTIDESATQLLQSSVVEEALRRVVDLDLLPRLMIRRAESREVVSGDVYAVERIRVEDTLSRYMRVYDITNSRYALIGFDAVAVVAVGVFARRKSGGVEVVFPMSLALRGRAWLTIDQSGQIAAAEIPYLDKIVPSTTESDLVLSTIPGVSA